LKEGTGAVSDLFIPASKEHEKRQLWVREPAYLRRVAAAASCADALRAVRRPVF
jgi:hypothetical protein